MSFRTHDVVPITEARARLTELAEDVVAGAEKVLTKNGSAYVALVDARKLDYYHALEAEHGRLVMLDDAEKGLKDALAGRTRPLQELRDTMRRRAGSKTK
jgi:prevent-host-death family protein